jgi:hypothetical protein
VESWDEPAVLDVLDRLVDQSLVQMDEVTGQARYRLLEPLRQFALEQLEACGEADEVGCLRAYTPLATWILGRMYDGTLRLGGCDQRSAKIVSTSVRGRGS